ncbi:MAG: tetratricopeptide repeat protein, partial [Cyanobacteria bacterium J06588_5]
MKRLNHSRACLVLLASMGMGVSALHPHSEAKASLLPAHSQTNPETKSNTIPPETARIKQNADADRALTEGITFIRQGDIAAAIAAFEQAASLNPNSAPAHYNLGLALRQNNQLQAAATAFWEATQADPGFVLAYVNLGAALLEGGSLNQADDYLN